MSPRIGIVDFLQQAYPVRFVLGFHYHIAYCGQQWNYTPTEKKLDKSHMPLNMVSQTSSTFDKRVYVKIGTVMVGGFQGV